MPKSDQRSAWRWDRALGLRGEKLHEFLATLSHFSFPFWSEFPKPGLEPEMGGMVLMLGVLLWLTSA
jgi:hypothetical protein